MRSFKLNSRRVEEVLNSITVEFCIKAEEKTDHTLLNTLDGIEFYEHGIFGEDVTILVKVGNEFFHTNLHEVPTLSELRNIN